MEKNFLKFLLSVVEYLQLLNLESLTSYQVSKAILDRNVLLNNLNVITKGLYFNLTCTHNRKAKCVFSKCDQIRITFTEEILNGKLHFLSSELGSGSTKLHERQLQRYFSELKIQKIF